MALKIGAGDMIDAILGAFAGGGGVTPASADGPCTIRGAAVTLASAAEVLVDASFLQAKPAEASSVTPIRQVRPVRIGR